MERPEPKTAYKIATDEQGRVIEYEESSQRFFLGAVATTFEKVMDLNKKGQLTWVSPKYESWALFVENSGRDSKGNSQAKMTGNQMSHICTTCGTVGRPKKETPGVFCIEVVLWVCGILPGLIYSLWRITSKRTVCPSCGGAVIPTDSPVGRKLTQN
jgi:hypothetical protein